MLFGGRTEQASFGFFEKPLYELCRIPTRKKISVRRGAQMLPTGNPTVVKAMFAYLPSFFLGKLLVGYITNIRSMSLSKLN
jgi:hypothetical protein